MVSVFIENWFYVSIFICMYKFIKVMYIIVDYCIVDMIFWNVGNDW